MTIKSRLTKLEQKRAGHDPQNIYVYFHDEEGFYLTYGGACYKTVEELAQAQGWPSDRGQRIEINYKDD